MRVGVLLHVHRALVFLASSVTALRRHELRFYFDATVLLIRYANLSKLFDIPTATCCRTLSVQRRVVAAPRHRLLCVFALDYVKCNGQIIHTLPQSKALTYTIVH